VRPSKARAAGRLEPLTVKIRFLLNSKEDGAVGILAWIVVGLIAGWLADQFTGRDHGLIKNMLVGMVGALVGGFLFSSLLGFSYYRGVNLATIFVATVGAVVFLYLLDWFRGRDRLTDRRR
jgi:uncharacterized membrane protein YeaQ/YmgE (transglycosylase-associated protein family)